MSSTYLTVLLIYFLLMVLMGVARRRTIVVVGCVHEDPLCGGAVSNDGYRGEGWWGGGDTAGVYRAITRVRGSKLEGQRVVVIVPGEATYNCGSG